MSSTEIAGLCNDLTQSDLNGLCNSRTALCQQVAASGNAAAIQAASTALCLRLSDLSVVAIYSINGQVDQLLRVLIAALRLRGTQVAMIVVVDGDHFKATVDTFSLKQLPCKFRAPVNVIAWHMVLMTSGGIASSRVAVLLLCHMNLGTLIPAAIIRLIQMLKALSR